MVRVQDKDKEKENAPVGETEFCESWNSMVDDGLVKQRVRDPDKPGKTITDAWRRAQRDPEQRERLKLLPDIRKAVEAADREFIDGWLNAAGVIGGKNKNRVWYLEQLLNGTYRQKDGSGRPHKTTEEMYGNHDPLPEFA